MAGTFLAYAGAVLTLVQPRRFCYPPRPSKEATAVTDINPDPLADAARVALGPFGWANPAPTAAPGRRVAFEAHFVGTAPSWFDPSPWAMDRLFAAWSILRDAEALTERLRPDVERLAELATAGKQAWCTATAELVDPNIHAGLLCDCIGELLADIVGLEACKEHELGALLVEVDCCPVPVTKRARRRPHVTLTVADVGDDVEHTVRLAVAS